MTRPLDETETVVGLAGDWHGNRLWAKHSLAQLADSGVTTLFHLGDLGIWPGPRGRQFMSELDESCRGHGITIYLTPGNHEDYDQINELPILDDGLQWLTEHVAVIPRGHRWTMAGRTFVSLGGAPSIDFPQRIEGETWWPAEAITDDDVDRVVAGGYADIMLAHDAPAPSTPSVNRIVGSGGGWTERGLAYAAVGRVRMTRAFTGVGPSVFVHGHYHVQDEATLPLTESGRSCQVVSLNCDGVAGNLALLDLDDWTAVDDEGKPGISHRWLKDAYETSSTIPLK